MSNEYMFGCEWERECFHECARILTATVQVKRQASGNKDYWSSVSVIRLQI